MELVYDDKGIQQEIEDAENMLEEELRDRKEIEGAFLSNGIRVTYMLQNNNGFHPRINSLYNLEIPLQERLIFEPNEIKKVDLGIKLGIPKGYMGIVMSSMEAPICIKGPMEVLYNTKKDFFQVAFQNVSDSKIVLEGGTMISQIAVKKCDISNCKLEWNELESRFDDTCNEEKEENGQCNDDGVNIEYCWIENNDELDSIRKGLGIINPDSYGIGFLKINLCDKPYGNHDLFTFMQSCERDHISLLERSSSRFESKLPLIHNEYFKMGNLEMISDHEILRRLSGDLSNYRRLSSEEMVDLQNRDAQIRFIKEDLRKLRMHKKFQIKKGVLCRSFYSKKNDSNLDTVYIPTNILKDVIIQIHLEELHPSGRQTYRSFAEHYYHPQAQKITRQICRSCEQCSKIRKQNTEIKYSMHVTRKRSLKPSKPREGLSLDVIELPESNHGYSYGLLISDLFTLYVSFYPMKDNNSAAVAHCLERYFSAQRTPKSVYTEDSHVFRGHVSHLLSRFRVTHVTTNLKSRRMSNVESQVKTLRNAYRSTILQSKFFQGHLWCKLFPIVICKMNAAISKYGINRESLYYGELIESSLPLLSDIDIFGPLEEDLEETCRKFRDKMGRLMGKKKRDKTKYRKGKENGICMHELVMREIFLEGQKVAMTYTGPYRVIDICGKGVTLRDLQTGDALSVSFEYVRKMNFDELLTLLPQKFEKEIMEALELLMNRKEK